MTTAPQNLGGFLVRIALLMVLVLTGASFLGSAFGALQLGDIESALSASLAAALAGAAVVVLAPAWLSPDHEPSGGVGADDTDESLQDEVRANDD